MKLFLIGSLVLTLNIALFGQKWSHSYGDPNNRDMGVDVFETYDNGYLVLVNIDYEKCWLIKTDINGILLWDKLIIDNTPDTYSIPNTVVGDNDGSIYLLGDRTVQSVSSWPFITKLDSCGEKVWCYEFQDIDYWYGYFKDAIVLSNGNVLALTHMEEQEDQMDQVFLYCISPEGELLWRKSYASKLQYPLFGVRSPLGIFFFNDHYVLSGDCYYAYPNNPSHKYLHPLYILIDSNFNEKCVIPYGMADSLTGIAYGVIPVNDTLFVGVGEFLHPPAYYNNDPDVIFNGLQMFFDTNCNECKYNVITNAMVDTNIKGNILAGIERINDSLFFVNSLYGDVYEGMPHGEYIIDTSGHIYKKQYHELIYGNPQLIKTFDEKFIIIQSIKENPNTTKTNAYLYKLNDYLDSDSLYPGPYVYDSLCNKPITSDPIDVTDCVITTSIQDPPLPQEYFNKQKSISMEVFPNPCDDVLYIRFNNPSEIKDFELEVINIFGRRVYISDKLKQEEVSVNTSGYSPGLYIILAKKNGEILGEIKFIKK